MKFVYDGIDRMLKEMNPQSYEDHQQLVQQGIEWFHRHPVDINTFMPPSSDAIHFWWYYLKTWNMDHHTAVASFFQDDITYTIAQQMFLTLLGN